MSRKGLSAEEKRTRMLQIFYEKKEFFQLKELEKIAPKEKGITEQSVKDVVQGLVDDGLVDTDKIGTSVYFWAFPSKAKHIKTKQLESMTEKLNDINNKLKISMENVIAAKTGREPTEERNEVLKKVAELKAEEESLQKEIKEYEMWEKMKNESEIAKKAVERWADNLMCVQSFCQNKFGLDLQTMDKYFGISAHMDF